MDCSICYEAYNDHSHIPKQLLCGHSLCVRCATSCTDSENKLRCPQCQSIMLAPRNTLTTNFELLNCLSASNANRQRRRVTFARPQVDDSKDILRHAKKLFKALIHRFTSAFEYLEEEEESSDARNDDVILWRVAAVRAVVIVFLLYSSAVLISFTLYWIKFLLSNLIVFILVTIIIAYFMRFHYRELIYSPLALDCRIFLNNLTNKWFDSHS